VTAAPSLPRPMAPPQLRPLAFTAAARAVAPALPGVLCRQRGAGQTLYLTFDDGPHPGDTPRLLDLLARHGARATFFLVGERAARRPDLVRALAVAGHTLGGHTHTHADPWRLRRASLAEELRQGTEAVEDASGAAVRWVRPPYGHLTPGFSRWARAHGQRVALWDVVPADFLPGMTQGAVAAALVRWARPGSLAVLHEGGHASAVTPDALALALPRLRDAGYTFAALP